MCLALMLKECTVEVLMIESSKKITFPLFTLWISRLLSLSYLCFFIFSIVLWYCKFFYLRRLTLKALKDISSGEEITISYLSECELERSRYSRQKILK